jgi:hypothetical protein
LFIGGSFKILLGEMGMLKKLTTPEKIVATVIFVLFSLVCFYTGDFFSVSKGNDREAQASIAKLDRDKVDKSVFEKQCDLTRAEIEKKADKDKVDIVQRRLDQIIGIMLDPQKKESVRAELKAEKVSRK